MKSRIERYKDRNKFEYRVDRRERFMVRVGVTLCFVSALLCVIVPNWKDIHPYSVMGLIILVALFVRIVIELTRHK